MPTKQTNQAASWFFVSASRHHDQVCVGFLFLLFSFFGWIHYVYIMCFSDHTFGNKHCPRSKILYKIQWEWMSRLRDGNGLFFLRFHFTNINNTKQQNRSNFGSQTPLATKTNSRLYYSPISSNLKIDFVFPKNFSDEICIFCCFRGWSRLCDK